MIYGLTIFPRFWRKLINKDEEIVEGILGKITPTTKVYFRDDIERTGLDFKGYQYEFSIDGFNIKCQDFAKPVLFATGDFISLEIDNYKLDCSLYLKQKIIILCDDIVHGKTLKHEEIKNTRKDALIHFTKKKVK